MKYILALLLTLGLIPATALLEQTPAHAGQTNCNVVADRYMLYRGCSTKTSSSWTQQRVVAKCIYPQNGAVAYAYGNWASVGQISVAECSHFYGVYARYYGYQTR